MRIDDSHLIPERLLINANIITLDPSQPKADWVLLGGGKILEVGDSDRLSCFGVSGVDSIDCRGQTLMPGFIDAHCHIRAYAESLVSLNLTPSEGHLSISDIQNRIREFQSSQPAGTWIRGKGYHEFHLSEQRHPDRWDLDAASSSHPIKLTHQTGFAHVLNSMALQAVGITAETGDPPGGFIDRDLETGEPTGLLYGMGEYLSQRIPPLDETDLEHGLVQANERLLACGITSVQDVSSHNRLKQWRQFSKWKEQGLIRSRISMMLGMQGFSEWDRETYSSPMEETQVKVGGVKIILGETTGSLYPSRKELEEQVSAIHKAGWQTIMHAVDENAIEAACDAVGHVLNLLHPCNDHRHRIDHCFVCPPHLAYRMNDLGITVVTQPSFIYYHGDRYIKTVPESQKHYLYPIHTLLKNGLLLAASSDFPLVDPNPLVGVYAAVTRLSKDKKAVLEEEGIERYEAIRMYTMGGATANFEEDIKGSISPGKLADLVLLSEDPLTVDAEKIKDIQVMMTILEGHVVWSRMPWMPS
jgi:predicted amidohydrolase YtcJ